MSYKQFILETVKNLIGLKVREVKIENGDFLALNFGDDVTLSRPPTWRLRIRNTCWATDTCKEHLEPLFVCHYIAPDQPTFDCEALDHNDIGLINSIIKNQVLEEIKVHPSFREVIFIFNDLELCVFGDEIFDDDPALASWFLYTPEHTVLCVSYAKARIMDELMRKKLNEL